MNTKDFKDFVRVWYEDNGRIGELIDRVYKTGYEHGQTECHQKSTSGDGLAEVTKEQVKRFLDDCCVELRSDLPTLAVALTEFFNDPNRQAPQKATMHPDLEWLARRDPCELLPNYTGPEPTRYYKTNMSTVAVYRSVGHRLNSKPRFTLAEVEQARRHLKEQDAIARANEFNRTLPFGAAPMKVEGALDPDEMRARECAPTKRLQEERLGLNNLPDYETWFEDHGGERTTEAFVVRPATVHELYTHFRARLLDELRQAGVIGDD